MKLTQFYKNGNPMLGIVTENGIVDVHAEAAVRTLEAPVTMLEAIRAGEEGIAVLKILAENPGIRLILDLHRDAAAVGNGQMDTNLPDYKRSKFIGRMFQDPLKGTAPNMTIEENLALAVKLQALLEQTYPGLCRPLNLCAERFNGDTSPGALLIEVGAAGNPRLEALLAAETLADGIIALVNGANLTEDSTN